MKQITIPLLALALLSSLLYPNKLSVKAQSLSYAKNQEELILKESVQIETNNSHLKADEAKATLKNNKILSYEARGNVDFFYEGADKQYFIKSNLISYSAKTQKYTLSGDIIFEDNVSNKMKANTVIVDAKNDRLTIQGDQEPVSLEFNIQTYDKQ